MGKTHNMRYQPILLLTIIAILLATSCKKDETAEDEDTTCTETREFWLNGTAGTWDFTTSQPCENLRLQQINVGQVFNEIPLGGEYLVILESEQQIVDSSDINYGTITVSFGILVPPSLIDTSITATDTVYSVSANNICASMKLGPHYQFLNQAQQNNTNMYELEYTDASSKYWKVNQVETDSSFVITSIDGIVSQSPLPGGYLPYCTVKFDYDVLLREHSSGDTIHVNGTGRLGFR